MTQIPDKQSEEHVGHGNRKCQVWRQETTWLRQRGVCRWDIPFSVLRDLTLPSPPPRNPSSLTFKPREQVQSASISAPCSLWPRLSFSSGTSPSWDVQPPDSPVIIHFLPPSYMSFLWPPSIFAVPKTILCPHLSHFTPKVHDFFWGGGGTVTDPFDSLLVSLLRGKNHAHYTYIWFFCMYYNQGLWGSPLVPWSPD